MPKIPGVLTRRYRPAATREILAWSFGLVRLPRPRGRRGWEAEQGTVHDQAIFGPVRDWECACGTYRGEYFGRTGWACERCGVTLANSTTRWRRFGHLVLPAGVAQPLGADGETLSVLPVLPAAYHASDGGRVLVTLYESLLGGSTVPGFSYALRVEHLFSHILPAALLALKWGLPERDTLVRALALVERQTEPG